MLYSAAPLSSVCERISIFKPELRFKNSTNLSNSTFDCGRNVAASKSYSIPFMAISPVGIFVKKKSCIKFVDSTTPKVFAIRSEEHTSELQSRPHLVCRLLLEKKKMGTNILNQLP